MSPVDPLTTLAGRFADEMWQRSTAALAVWQPVFAEECARSGIDLRRICEAQTDETLALAFQKEVFTDAVFVELLVTRFGPQLSRWFVRHGRRYGQTVGDELANELIQETWYRLFAGRLSGYDPTRVFGSFLFVVSRNLFVQRVIRLHREEPLGDWDDRTHADTVGLEVEFHEMAERLDVAVSHLSTEHREVLLHTLAGHPPEEIAGMLGIPVQMVYRRLFSARRAVERELSG
jgi:RNA polymerase sigma factor (sigma-70 family)